MLLALVVLYSCHSKKNENADGYASELKLMDVSMPAACKETVQFVPPVAEEESVTTKEQLAPPVQGVNRGAEKKKIIKDGNMSIETKDVYACKKSMDEQLKKLNAYYENENLQNTSERISYDLKIRIPASNFEKLISAIEQGEGAIRLKNIQTRDVTEEYMDIETRLTTKKEYLKRYKELLSRAKNVEEVLQIEENIRVLQEEIESKEGRLNYLNDQVEFSTLDLYIFKEKEIPVVTKVEERFLERVKKALRSGWTGVVDFTLEVIHAWPLISIVGAMAYLIRRMIKRRNKKKQQ